MTTADPRALRNAFGAFLTGVTVVTARDSSGAPIGFTANSFASVSLDPPLLLVCLARTSRNFETLTKAAGFAVNILAEDQKDVSNTFARPVEDRFATVGWRFGPHGSPVLDGVAAWFDCSMHQIVDGGDHVILIGKVEGFDNSTLNGLGYARGSYFTPSMVDKAVSAAASDRPVVVAAVAEREGQVLLLERDKGPLAMPQTVVDGAARTDALEAHLADLTGLSVTSGFIYSVYLNNVSGQHHIVYRCNLGDGEPKAGRFVTIADLPNLSYTDTATRDVLIRYASESAVGNFGVYVGNEQSGQVHPLARKV